MIVIARLEALAALADTAQVRLDIGKDIEMAAETFKILTSQLDAVVAKLRDDARAKPEVAP